MPKQTYAERFAAAKEQGKLKRIAPKLLKFTEGMTIVGEFVTREVVPSTKKNIPDSFRYVVDTDDGLVSFFTSNAFDKSQGSILKEGKVYAFQNNGKIPWKTDQEMWDIAAYNLDNDEDEEEENGEEEG